MYHTGLAQAIEWNFFAYCYQPELYSRNTRKITTQCFKRVAGEVILKAIQALRCLHGHVQYTSLGKSVITVKIYQKQSNFWKQQLITQGKLIQVIGWHYLLLVGATPNGKTCHHSQSRPELRSHNQITKNHIYSILKWKFQGTCTCNLLAVIGQLLIVVSHHVHASRLHNLHNFDKECPTHSVHVEGLKTNHKKW